MFNYNLKISSITLSFNWTSVGISSLGYPNLTLQRSLGSSFHHPPGVPRLPQRSQPAPYPPGTATALPARPAASARAGRRRSPPWWWLCDVLAVQRWGFHGRCMGNTVGDIYYIILYCIILYFIILYYIMCIYIYIYTTQQITKTNERTS